MGFVLGFVAGAATVHFLPWVWDIGVSLVSKGATWVKSFKG